MTSGAFEPNPWCRFLEEVVAGGCHQQRPRDLERTYGAAFVEALTKLDLLIPGGCAQTIPSPDFEQPGEWEVVANPNEDDFDHPRLARPIDGPAGIGVFLRDDELRTVKLSLRRFGELVRAALRIQGQADWARPVFPNAHRLGQVEWSGMTREALLCTDLNGPAPALHLQLRQTRCLPTLVLTPTQTRWMRPEVQSLVGAGLVTVAFLDELLAMERGKLVRTPRAEALQGLTSLCERPTEYCSSIQSKRVDEIYCRCLDAEGEHALTQTEYQQLLSAISTCDLALDLTQTREAGRHPAWRREAGASIEGSVTPQQGAAFAELMEAQRPLRPAQLKALHGTLHPERQIEAARRALDGRLGRYEWRATKLIKGESPEAAQYWFKPPENLRWVLLRPA